MKPILFLLLMLTMTTSHSGDLAFYYGDSKNPPLNQLKLYPNIVVQPYSGIDPKQLNTPTRQVFAYVSLGEAWSMNQYGEPLDKRWIIGKNLAWHSLVLDQTNPSWQKFYMDKIITPLWNQGYRGFFLDTLDSYRLVSTDPESMKKQQEGLIALIKAMKHKYPDAKLILNRGFEIIPRIHADLSGVVAESLLHGWNNQTQQYFTVSAEESHRLLIELNAIKKMGLPVTVVDYVHPRDQDKATRAAQQIAHFGFNAWITDGQMTHFYPINSKSIARKILILYRGQLNNRDEKIGSDAMKNIAMPLNHLGYVTELRNVNEPLPIIRSNHEYAGVITLIDGILLGHEEALHTWYITLIKQKIPLVILNNFGFILDNNKLKIFGLSLPMPVHRPHALTITYKSPMVGYELNPLLKTSNFIPLQLNKNHGLSLLKVRDDVDLETDLAAITSWGGYYAGDSFLPTTLNDHYVWAIDPFLFFKQALKLPDQPIPDTTTENGLRLFFTHIDGDGFSNKGEWYNAPYAGDIMRQEIIERFHMPTTVSVTQGEIAANGIHPELSKDLELIAKKIFALPNVEIASHTYSHPFNWKKAAAYHGASPNPNHLPINDYHFNINTEVAGSVNYINQHLAPAEKKCKVFLWSGEGDVPEQALALSDKLGLRNLNPGTMITKYQPSDTRISALGINEGHHFQVFAPIGNDVEVHGNSNERFFYTIIHIIDAFKLTEAPRRLKPMDIYVHFFTMAQPGGIKALQRVYRWALSQPNMPIYASEYVDKVIDFNKLLIAKKGNGWIVETSDALREMRIPHALGYPDLMRSQNVMGYSSLNNDYYIHLGPGGESFIQLTKQPPKEPYLVNANARVSRYVHKNHSIHFTFEGHVPLQFTLANMQHCALSYNHKPLSPSATQGQQQHYRVPKETTGEVMITCH
jgi:hypothetical protein